MVGQWDRGGKEGLQDSYFGDWFVVSETGERWEEWWDI